MRIVLTLITIAGLGGWLWKEIQHGQDLEAQLDEAKKQLEAYQAQAQMRSVTRPPGQWMWGTDPGNPLNYPTTRVGKPTAVGR
jgi:hypothetical protein